MQDQVKQLAAHDGYRLQIEASQRSFRACVNSTVIAESCNVLIMRETRYPPVHYFPRSDVAMQHLVATSHRTHCPFKGDASYWSVKIGDRTIENVAWSYEDPYDEAETTKDYIAFYWDQIDEWTVDEMPMAKPVPAGKAPANPFVPWLVNQAWRAASVPDLLTRLSTQLTDAKFPIWRMRLLIQTNNPQLFARGCTWQKNVEGIEEFQATHAGMSTPQFQDSTFAAIINGEGGIRRRLEGANAQIDFPVLHDLVAEGATDYVAVPMRFSDGQINILVLVSDKAGGFTTEQLGQIYEILPNLSRLLEAHSQRDTSLTLLQTYLGKNAGRMVMDGLVKRGDAEELNAVIMISDLRGSTHLADILPKEEYLAALNTFFDCVAGAAIDNNGEVLKFIGDAVLAVFPIDASGPSDTSAYDQALSAVVDAQQRLDRVNEQAKETDGPTLRFGTGLHCGTVTFGNVGTPGRLDFTVIGAGVNETARIAEKCKELDHRVIISEALAACINADLESLGKQELRGIRQSQELFALKPIKHDHID